MAAHFTLDVDTDPAGVVRLTLLDEHDTHLAARQVRLQDHAPSMWEGLFDTRAHVQRYQGALAIEGQSAPATAEQLLDRVGVFLGQKVLGPGILGPLAQGIHKRGLEVRLPDPGAGDLAAALARVPWETARPGPQQPPLGERNVIVRAVHRDGALDSAPIPLPMGPDDPLRVLLVFAEAPGSRLLAMRLEREQLFGLFFKEVLPRRQVQVDVLCHGVTRGALREMVTSQQGYHVLHWSGHGHRNLLELSGEDGGPDPLSGEELMGLLADAGGYLPHLVFLSACLSGAVIRDWEALRAALRGEPVRAAEPDPTMAETLQRRPGYAGTALSLLRTGVPQVVAMRYEVDDAYARELAVGFYRHLLADQSPSAAEGALALARGELRRQGRPDFAAVNHVTPLILGVQGRPLPVVARRSRQMDRRHPRPQPLLSGGRGELDRRASFVGRGAELTRLARRWVPRPGTPDGDRLPAAALLQGQAGMGKTSLAAEAVHLWHTRFDWVFAFTSRPGGLLLKEFYLQLDQKLSLASRAYRDRCEEEPYARVYLQQDRELSGAVWHDRLRSNALEALGAERVLLVLDNFEAQLQSVGEATGYACNEPQWDTLLRELAAKLPETGSRVLVTSRHRLAALGSKGCLWVPLGPLPMDEARLFLQDQPALVELVRGDEAGRELAERLLRVSRGHPLILSRLGAQAADRLALADVLDRLEERGLKDLPDLFAQGDSHAERERERGYLEDVAEGSVDLLIERAGPDARRVLWLVSLAGEPVAGPVLAGVWDGPAPTAPMLEELLGAGLLVAEGPERAPVYGCHELVRERMEVWMAAHRQEQGDRSREQAWVAYGKVQAAAFWTLHSAGAPHARGLAAEAGRRSVGYFVRARAFQELGTVVSEVVTGTPDPVLLRAVIGDLRMAAEQVPPGQVRSIVRLALADALDMADQTLEALPLYEQAAAEAEAGGQWKQVGSICQNWAIALTRCAQPDAAQDSFRRSAEAHRKAGGPAIDLVSSEMESWRIDVMRGRAEQILPQIALRLAEVRCWWQQQRAGQAVPEAPDPLFLGRVWISALDLAMQANLALERWEACLGLVDEMVATQQALGEGQYEIVKARFNKHGPLLELKRYEEAKVVLEGCLEVFRTAGDVPRQAAALSGLADMWSRQGDLAQAVAVERQALVVRNGLTDPLERTISHCNLANFLDRSRQHDEAARHRLADIVYCVATGHQQGLQQSLRNLAAVIREAARSGAGYELPRLAGLLSRPEFDALRRFLNARSIDPGAVQGEIDQREAQVRAAIAQPG